MKNFIKLIGAITMIAVIGFSMAACSDDDGDGGDVTFNVTNNYSSKVVSVRIDSNVNSDDQKKTITINAGGTGSFSATLTKIITGNYMGQLYFYFENDSTEYGPAGSSYSFNGPGPKFNITIGADGKHQGSAQ